MRLKYLLSLGLAATICGVSQVSASAIEPVAVDLSGVALPSGASGISDNGRYVLWRWTPGSIPSWVYEPDMPDDGPYPIYLKDMETGINKNVYVNSDGEPADVGTNHAVLSGNGRYVVFPSRASNLDPLDTNNTAIPDLFKHDVITGETAIINIGYDGTVTNDSYLHPRSLSDDGRYLLFLSHSSQLVANDNNNKNDVFVADLSLNTIKRVSVASTGAELPYGIYPSGVAMSDNGQFVTFNTFNAGYRDLYVHDQIRGTTEPLYANDANNSFGGQCGGPTVISNDGRYAIFSCAYSSLNGVEYRDYANIKVDRVTGEYKALERIENGVLTHLGMEVSSMSDDGRYVLMKISENVVNGQASRKGLHIMDTESGTFQEIYASESGGGVALADSMSGDGRYATFVRWDSPIQGRTTVYRFDKLYQSCNL